MKLFISRKRFDQLDSCAFEAWLNLFPADALSARLFMHPEFCEAAHRTLGPVEVVVLEEGERIVGIVPLNRATGVRGWLCGYTQVAQDVSDGFCFPVEEPYVGMIASILMKAGVWSGFFTHFPAGKYIPDIQAGAMTKTYVMRRHDGSEDLWGQIRERSRKFWSDTERCARRLNELPGGYRFYWQSQYIERDLDILINLKLEQYARTKKTAAALFQEGFKAFLKAVALKKVDGFSAPLSVLYCGDQLVAAHLGLLGIGRLHYWFPVYNTAYSKYSPGRVLLSEIIKHCSTLDIQIIDLGEGYADYKEAVANETHDLVKAVVAPGMLGKVSMLPLRWAWRVGS